MSRMLKDADDVQRKNIKANQIHGIEAREDMFSIATTNMILRGDGQSNLLCGDFFEHDAGKLQLLGGGVTVGFMNPPYSQAKNSATAHLSELRFILHLLESVTVGGRVAVIVPVSAMIGKNRDDKVVKAGILQNHTLEGVISLNKNTFYRIGVVPCIAVFTAGEPHPAGKLVKFVNFENDGFEVKKHVGLVETERAKDRKKFLLDCWRGKIDDVPSKFMVTATIDAGDEWLHSFYYYNDELPTEDDFANTVADYLTFEFNMIAHGRGYLFDAKKNFPTLTETSTLGGKVWREFCIGDLFRLETGKGKGANHLVLDERGISYLGATNRNNAVLNFVRPVENLIQRGNCIAFIRNGEGSVGYSVYKREDFIATSDITCGYADFLNEYVGWFITTVADQVRGKYNFNYKRSDTRLKREKILLPVTEDDKPDFAFMESYVRSLEEKILRRYREFVAICPPLR